VAAADKPAAAFKGKFNWPLKGALLKGFGGGGGSPIKGVEISAAAGTPVLSAAAGRVIYSGDGIRTYGNLIILRHDNDFFTVYGFNQKNIVDAGTFVSKGERIALSGAPPAGGKPRLYFEIRRGKEPVDPIFYLP
jgi:lipoprotein NlpD